MRVHGRYIIKRRTGLDQREYKKYEPELSEDFHHICGYCGKSEAVTKKGFEIDHFVPQTLSEELANSRQRILPYRIMEMWAFAILPQTNLTNICSEIKQEK